MIHCAYQVLLQVTLNSPIDPHEMPRIAMILQWTFRHIVAGIYPISVVLARGQKLKLLYAANR